MTWTALLLSVAIAGCSSSPAVRPDGVRAGVWSNKVLVTDKIRNKSAALSMDVSSAWPDRMRAEISATLGVSVMTLALNGTQVSYVLPRLNKYFNGPASEKVFQQVIHDMPLDPRWVMALLFDRPIHGIGWTCAFLNDELGKRQLSGCDNDTSQIKVQVSKRSGEKRLILITTPAAEVKIQIQNFKEDATLLTQSADRFFTITKPDGFLDISKK